MPRTRRFGPQKCLCFLFPPASNVALRAGIEQPVFLSTHTPAAFSSAGSLPWYRFAQAAIQSQQSLLTSDWAPDGRRCTVICLYPQLLLWTGCTLPLPQLPPVLSMGTCPLPTATEMTCDLASPCCVPCQKAVSPAFTSLSTEFI